MPPVVNPTDLRRVRPDTGALEAGRARTRGGGNFFWGARMGAWVHGWGEGMVVVVVVMWDNYCPAGGWCVVVWVGLGDCSGRWVSG